jgi:hypothetical protein
MILTIPYSAAMFALGCTCGRGRAADRMDREDHPKHADDTVRTDDGDMTQVVPEIDWTANAGAGITPG